MAGQSMPVILSKELLMTMMKMAIDRSEDKPTLETRSLAVGFLLVKGADLLDGSRPNNGKRSRFYL